MPVSSNLCVTALSYVQFIFKPNFVPGRGAHCSTLSLLLSGEAGLSKEREITIIVCQSDSKLLCSVNAGAFECFQFYYYCKARGGPGPSLREQFLFTANNDAK